MNIIDTVRERNATFATTQFDKGLRMLPKAKTLVVGCVDPRVDPATILGLELGDAAIIRNIGGRVTPETLATFDMLRAVAKAGGGDVADGWNILVLHHTDCGITRLGQSPALLADYFRVPVGELGTRAIHDPRRSVALDIATMKAHAGLSERVLVTGLVYDVGTGLVESVVPTEVLRA